MNFTPDPPKIKTLGELKNSGWHHRSVRDELRENTLSRLKSGGDLFPGILGYDQTVIPQLLNALLSKHDILLLGLRGQAKTRLLRMLVQFLDEWAPYIETSPLKESPYEPITKHSLECIEIKGDETPIAWMHRTERFNEKLATPDVSMVDLIGDIDPIRASREKLDLSDERVIHYGIIARTHRGIFLINEIPDLQTRIQVGLLNILEERDIQIRGFPIRLPLDIMMLFTANPEDYTNRGNIITPLKDRIASQIITHYPKDIDHAISITEQEADLDREVEVYLPPFIKEIIEEVSIQARQSEHVDQSSGVSARLSISAMELLASNLERRKTILEDTSNIPRLLDLFSTIPAICGKIELVYEGEQEGPILVAEKILGQSIKAVFQRIFPPVHSSKKSGSAEELYTQIQSWFNQGQQLKLTDFENDSERYEQLNAIPGLFDLVEKYAAPNNLDEAATLAELVLEGLHQNALLSREGEEGAVVYVDFLKQMLDDDPL